MRLLGMDMIIPEVYVLSKEDNLYSNMSVADKYDILEEMRITLDYLYANNRPIYEKCRSLCRPTTWEALEDAWKLWYPAPQNTGSWGGAHDMTYTLDERSPYYDCLQNLFIQCTYDEHGSPNFDKVTYPDSIVDISDLYDAMPIEHLIKRGGSRNSLQEIAQDRMAIKLESAVRIWAQKNKVEYDRYCCFYKWRNENDLVPHEDTNCRTMRLVFRPAHKAFTHRGGISNAKNIKSHFSI